MFFKKIFFSGLFFTFMLVSPASFAMEGGPGLSAQLEGVKGRSDEEVRTAIKDIVKGGEKPDVAVKASLAAGCRPGPAVAGAIDGGGDAILVVRAALSAGLEPALVKSVLKDAGYDENLVDTAAQMPVDSGSASADAVEAVSEPVEEEAGFFSWDDGEGSEEPEYESAEDSEFEKEGMDQTWVEPSAEGTGTDVPK